MNKVMTPSKSIAKGEIELISSGGQQESWATALTLVSADQGTTQGLQE
jgi:hypothetical protein